MHVFTERRGVLCCICLGILAISATAAARGQTPRQPVNPWEHLQAHQQSLTPAMQYFTGYAGAPAGRQQTRRPMSAARHVPGWRGKPFQNVVRPQTLSPYLNLDLIDNQTGLPNYHALVRPLVRQREATQEQSMKMRRRQQQVRTAAASGIVSRDTGGTVATPGQRGQFLNMGSYYTYPDLRR